MADASREMSKSGSSRAFGKKKKNDDTPETRKVQKSKSFKRIRGFLRGESRKEKRARKEEERKKAGAAAAASSRSLADEESTIYGVDVDDRSVLSPQETSAKKKAGRLEKENKGQAKKAYMLKVVLLLMDPKTRRFELLQLEFDSNKALVSDVLSQIPVSVTEEALRQQTYTGICGNDGKEMTATMLLSSFCKGNEVLVAIPDDVPSKECARLAKPILGDNKVIDMLASSGIDATGWREDTKKAGQPPVLEPKPARKEMQVRVDEKSEKKEEKGGRFPWLFAVIVIGLLLQVFHVYISAPIKPGHVVAPGIWLSKCGLLGAMKSCDNSYFTMDKEGKMTVYGPDREVAWEAQGDVCAEGDESCTPGMEFKEDGSIIIGGKPISGVYMFQNAELSPWPFAEKPAVRVWKKY